jgi:allatostatin receptor
MTFAYVSRKCYGRQVEHYSMLGEDRSTCMNARLVSDTAVHDGRVFYGTFFAFAFVVPLTAVTLLYSLMVQRLLRSSLTSRTGSGKTSESTKAKRRVTRMVIVVVVIFAVCWFPLQVGCIIHAVFASRRLCRVGQKTAPL